MRILGLCGIIFIGLGVRPGSAQSLADVARQERARQEKSGAPDTKPVYTNADLERYRNTAPVTTLRTEDSKSHRPTPSDRAAPAGFWRQRMARAQERIRALELKVAHYDNRLREPSAPSLRGRRSTRTRAPAMTRLEQQKVKAERELELAREAQYRLEEEARRAGVLPGALRGWTR